MEHYDGYLKHLNSKEAGYGDSIRSSLQSFVRERLEDYDYTTHSRGLLIGEVQSGKTGQMLGIISAAADLGFKFYVILTTDNTRLQKQTLIRAKIQLAGFVVCDEKDDLLFRNTAFSKPVVLVLKKNTHVLRSWIRNISINQVARNHPLLLLDDEGDAASLNTQINSGEESTINTLVNSLVSTVPSSLYLSVTATPNAVLLQGRDSEIRPTFVYSFEPGPGYLGGSHFYANASSHVPILDSEREILLNQELIPNGLQRSLIYFVLTVIEFMDVREHDSCTMLVHPSLRIADHATVHEKVNQYLAILGQSAANEGSLLSILIQNVLSEHPEFSREGQYYLDRTHKACEAIDVMIINSESGENAYDTGYNIVIGGNSLGRGVTFPRLQVTYYCRTSRVPQADTVWQHSRLFGYDRIPQFCKIFAPTELMHLFQSLTESNTALFRVLREKGVEGIQILSPQGTRPTRRSVIDRSALVSYVGGVNYFCDDVAVNNISEIDQILGLEDVQKKVSIVELIRLLELMKPAEESEIDSFLSCVQSLRSVSASNCQLIVRTDRDISRNTGTLLSPNDRILSTRYPGELVLFCYRLNGKREQGWNDSPLWIPNIRFPDGVCFFGVN